MYLSIFVLNNQLISFNGSNSKNNCMIPGGKKTVNISYKNVY